jgi:hypothetical protein
MDEDSDERVPEETATTEPEPVISLHVITGIRTEDTMQLQVIIQGSELVALLDTGSTHTFINQKIAECLGLEFRPCSGLTVAVANGDKVACKGIANCLNFRFASQEFSLKTFAIPLDSLDVILCVDFLRTLGPILWDLDDLCMAF